MVTTGYLNTRGRERSRDYQFLGPAPRTAWWRAYAEHTTFEQPTVLVQSDGRGWQAYLSGIPSRRRDAVGTVIRYTVVADGSADGPDAGEIGTGDVLALVANWLADQDLGRADGRVSAALDAAFPEPDVERLLGAGPAVSAASGAEVAGRLATALHELRLPDPGSADQGSPGWLADLSDPTARAAFLQRVDALLAGQPGRALVLNLVGEAADLLALLDDPHPLAVLAPELPDPAATVLLLREPAKKAPPPPGTIPPEPATTTSRPAPPPSPPPSRTPSPTPSSLQSLRGGLRTVLVTIVLILALLLGLFGTLFYPF